MADLAAHKNRKVERPEDAKVRNMNVAASEQLYNGALVTNAAGVAVNANNNEFFMGVTRDGYLNSVASPTTDSPLVVETGQIEEMTFNGAITDADIGKKVWIVDSATVTLTDPVTIPQAQVGVLVRVTTSPNGLVDTSKAVS